MRLVGAVYRNAILIPSSALLNTTQGLVAYVVDANNTIVARPVQAQLQDDMYIVTDGLKAGERILREGLIKVRPGQQVQVAMQDFKIGTAKEEVQPLTQNGRSVAKLEEEIEDSEAPDAQALPQEAQQDASAETNTADASQAPAAPAAQPAAQQAPAAQQVPAQQAPAAQPAQPAPAAQADAPAAK